MTIRRKLQKEFALISPASRTGRKIKRAGKDVCANNLLKRKKTLSKKKVFEAKNTAKEAYGLTGDGSNASGNTLIKYYPKHKKAPTQPVNDNSEQLVLPGFTKVGRKPIPGKKAKKDHTTKSHKDRTVTKSIFSNGTIIDRSDTVGNTTRIVDRQGNLFGISGSRAKKTNLI